MKQRESRQVDVSYCDICKEEATYLDRCAICKRDLCLEGGGARHCAFSVEIYKHGDGKRLRGFGSKICHDCADKKFDGTLRDLFNGIMGEAPVPVKD